MRSTSSASATRRNASANGATTSSPKSTCTTSPSAETREAPSHPTAASPSWTSTRYSTTTKHRRHKEVANEHKAIKKHHLRSRVQRQQDRHRSGANHRHAPQSE